MGMWKARASLWAVNRKSGLMPSIPSYLSDTTVTTLRPARLPIATYREALADVRHRAHGPLFLVGKSTGARSGCHVAIEDPLCPLKLRDAISWRGWVWHNASMQRLFAFAMALVLGLVFAREARAAEPDVAPSLARSQPLATPAGLLAAADAAVGAGDLPLARSLFEQLATQFSATPEASEARRALAIIAVRVSPSSHALRPGTGPAAGRTDAASATDNDEIIVRNEPYSRKTSERLRLTIWEKVDFSVTSFLYGMSLGLSFSLSQNSKSASDVLTPVALGAIAYTLGSVAFLKLANPDRGDLPLALTITSYIPTTTLLVLSAADANPNGHTTGMATTVAGLLSIPIAVVAAQHLDLDPGDTQLVRDAGFWGLALSTIGMLGFGGHSASYYGSSQYQSPSGRESRSRAWSGCTAVLASVCLAPGSARSRSSACE
jgi:hypothetical protein